MKNASVPGEAEDGTADPLWDCISQRVLQIVPLVPAVPGTQPKAPVPVLSPKLIYLERVCEILS